MEALKANPNFVPSPLSGPEGRPAPHNEKLRALATLYRLNQNPPDPYTFEISFRTVACPARTYLVELAYTTKDGVEHNDERVIHSTKEFHCINLKDLNTKAPVALKVSRYVKQIGLRSEARFSPFLETSYDTTMGGTVSYSIDASSKVKPGPRHSLV